MAKDPTNLGELEMAILEYLWQRGGCDVKAVYADLGQQRQITHNTVQSTLKRLWEKRLLTRRKEGHAYLYSPKVNRRELTELMMNQLMEQLTGSEIDVAMQAFVNLTERAGAESLARLEKLVATRRASEEEEQQQND